MDYKTWWVTLSDFEKKEIFKYLSSHSPGSKRFLSSLAFHWEKRGTLSESQIHLVWEIFNLVEEKEKRRASQYGLQRNKHSH